MKGENVTDISYPWPWGAGEGGGFFQLLFDPFRRSRRCLVYYASQQGGGADILHFSMKAYEGMVSYDERMISLSVKS